jgi:hypothetical protein
MSDLERQQADGGRQADDRPDPDDLRQAMSSGAPAAGSGRPAGRPGDAPIDESERPSLAGRLGGAAIRLDRTLSQRVPDRVTSEGRRLSEGARKRIQSGQWQNYAVLAVLALIALSVAVLLLRGCAGVGT